MNNLIIANLLFLVIIIIILFATYNTKYFNYVLIPLAIVSVNLYNEFYNKPQQLIIIGGSGAVSGTILEILEKTKKWYKILIIDPKDFKNCYKLPITHYKYALNAENIDTLNTYIHKSSIVLDISVNVDALAVIKICDEKRCTYINTSLENWETNEFHINPAKLYERSLCYRMKLLYTKFKNTKAKIYVEMGMNPGIISFLTQKALIDYVRAQKLDFESEISMRNFAKIARDCGLRTIHIAEKDTQITNNTYPSNYFVNTWSAEGFIAEALDPVQIGYGSHETNTSFVSTPNKNIKILAKRGIDTLMNSVVSTGPIQGYCIPHGESNTISDHLTHGEYRPSVYYVYDCSQSAKKGLEMIRENTTGDKKFTINYDPARVNPADFSLNIVPYVLNLEEIQEGYDEVGALLCFENKLTYLCSSILDVKESHKLGFRKSGPTTIQVAACINSLLNSTLYEGIHTPDDLNYDFMLKNSKKYLGTIFSDFVPNTFNGLKFEDFNVQ